MVRCLGSFKNGVTLIFAGPPGAGKGTYGKILAKRWGMSHVSVGELIRAERPIACLGVASKSRADRGLLIPDDVVAEICKQHICSKPLQNSWILDGFPRTLEQADMLREFASPHVCVNFKLPFGILMQKLLGRRICKTCGQDFNMADIREIPYELPAILPQRDCKECNGDAPLLRRVDDTAEVIQKRLKIYEKSTKPVIDLYDREGILLNFDVLHGIGDMTRLESAITSFLQRKYDLDIKPRIAS